MFGFTIYSIVSIVLFVELFVTLGYKLYAEILLIIKLVAYISETLSVDTFAYTELKVPELDIFDVFSVFMVAYSVLVIFDVFIVYMLYSATQD